MTGPTAARTRRVQRTVSHRNDPAEVQADRAADAVARGGSVTGWNLASVSLRSGVHREETTKPTDEDKAKEAARKAAEAALETDAGKALKERVLADPLVKAATSFVDTTPGKIVAGGVAAAGVGALAATGQELPFQTPAILLDRLAPGLSAEVKVEGPLNAPTFVGLSLTYKEQGGKGKRGPSASERIAADTARLRAQQQQFVPKEEKDRQHAEEQAAAVAWMLAQQRQRFGTTTLLPLLPGTKPKTLDAPAEQPEEEKKEDAEVSPVQREAATATADAGGIDTGGIDEALAETGRALDSNVRRSMEARLGQDFSGVRLHDGATAERAAGGIDAKAFTVGDDIVFAGGVPEASTYEGRHLLAHELAHVVQQRSARPGHGTLPMVHRRSVGEWLGIFFGAEEGTWTDQELRDYLLKITSTSTLEGAFDSDNKARALVQKWKTSAPGWDLSGRQKSLLIDEMLDGPTGDDDEDAILDLLELSDAGDLRMIFRKSKERFERLDSDLDWSQHDRLLAFVAKRFKGGRKALVDGKAEVSELEILGDRVPAAAPAFAFDADRLDARLDGDDTAQDIIAVVEKMQIDDRRKALAHLLHVSLIHTTDERGRTAMSYVAATGERKKEFAQRLFALNDKQRKLKCILPLLLLNEVPAGQAELESTKAVPADKAQAVRDVLAPKQYDPLDDDLIELDPPDELTAPAASPTVVPGMAPPATTPEAEAARKKADAKRAKEEERRKHGPGSEYRKKVQEAIVKIIDDFYQSVVVDKGSHADPVLIEPMAEPAKDATDAVFGKFYVVKDHPPMTTKMIGKAKPSLRSWHERFSGRYKRQSDAQRVDSAFVWILYYFQSEMAIRILNDQYDATPKFRGKRNPDNVAAETLVLIAKELVKDGVSGERGLSAPKTTADKLNATQRDWSGMTSGGKVFVDLYLPADAEGSRSERWQMLQTLIHEYIHTLVAQPYEDYARTFGTESNEWNTLIEGVDEVFTLMVWARLAAQVTQPALRTAVEGAEDAALPPIDVPPPSTYDSYAEAIRLTELVGIQNLIAAYFAGRVDRVRGPGGPTGGGR